MPGDRRRLGGGDEDAGGLFGAGIGVEADDDFDVAAEAGEEVHEALDGKAVEAIARRALRDFGLVNAELAGGAGHWERRRLARMWLMATARRTLVCFSCALGRRRSAKTLPELLTMRILPLFLGMAFLGVACLIFAARTLPDFG